MGWNVDGRVGLRIQGIVVWISHGYVERCIYLNEKMVKQQFWI